jgi:hypothetical protein
MTTIYFGAIGILPSHEDGKGEVATMSGKDDVPPLASVKEARELKACPQIKKILRARARAGARDGSSHSRYLLGQGANRPSMHGFKWRRARSLSKLKW